MDALTKKQALILDAQKKGFRVFHDDAGDWYIETPHRPRHPSAILGSYRDPDRAWMAAALIAREITGL